MRNDGFGLVDAQAQSVSKLGKAADKAKRCYMTLSWGGVGLMHKTTQTTPNQGWLLSWNMSHCRPTRVQVNYSFGDFSDLMAAKEWLSCTLVRLHLDVSQP